MRRTPIAGFVSTGASATLVCAQLVSHADLVSRADQRTSEAGKLLVAQPDPVTVTIP